MRSRARWTESAVREWLDENNRTDVTLLTFGGSANAQSTWLCTQCGDEWSTKASTIINGSRCKSCVHRVTESDVRARLVKLGRTDLELVEYAGGTQGLSTWRCVEGHGEWKRSANEILNRNGRCKTCQDIRLGVSRRISEEEVRRRISDRTNVELIEYGGTASAKSLWRCNDGHEWQATATSIMAGSGCRRRARRPSSPARRGSPPPISEAAVRERMRTAGRSNLELVDYAGTAYRKSTWRCLDCRYEWQSDIRTIGRAACPNCSRDKVNKGLRLEEAAIRERLASRGRDDMVELVEYAGSTKNPNSLWRCQLCGYEWEARAGHVLKSEGQRSSSCPACQHLRGGVKMRLSEEDLRARLTQLGRDDLELLEYGGNTRQASLWRCKHGHEWRTAVANVFKGSGCWECSGRGFALTEDVVRERLAARSDLVLTEYGGSTAHHSSEFRCVKSGHVWRTQVSSVLAKTNPSSCPSCQTYGFNPSRPTWLYLLHHEEGMAFKVGVTNDLRNRVEYLHTKNGWTSVNLWRTDGWLALHIEALIVHSWREAGLPPAMPRGSDGFTETVSAMSIEASQIILEIERLTRIGLP